MANNQITEWRNCWAYRRPKQSEQNRPSWPLRTWRLMQTDSVVTGGGRGATLRCCVLNSHKCSTSIFDLGEIVHVLKAGAIVTSALINDFCGRSLFEFWGVPWIEVKPGSRGPQKVFLPWTEMSLQDPSIEVAIQRQCEHFSGTKFFVLWMQVSVE